MLSQYSFEENNGPDTSRPLPTSEPRPEDTGKGGYDDNKREYWEEEEPLIYSPRTKRGKPKRGNGHKH